MLNPEQLTLINFVEEQAPTLPVAKRIEVYRGLADSLNDRAWQLVFLGKAEILEEAERKCAELKFAGPPTHDGHNGKDGQ